MHFQLLFFVAFYAYSIVLYGVRKTQLGHYSKQNVLRLGRRRRKRLKGVHELWPELLWLPCHVNLRCTASLCLPLWKRSKHVRRNVTRASSNIDRWEHKREHFALLVLPPFPFRLNYDTRVSSVGLAVFRGNNICTSASIVVNACYNWSLQIRRPWYSYYLCWWRLFD